MNETDVHDVVVKAIHRVAPDADPSQLSPTADFREVLEIDSMDFLILVDELHARTGVDIPDRDYPQLTTIEGCVKFLAARGPTATPASSSASTASIPTMRGVERRGGRPSQEPTDTAEIERLVRERSALWAAGRSARWLRVVPSKMTGRHVSAGVQ